MPGFINDPNLYVENGEGFALADFDTNYRGYLRKEQDAVEKLEADKLKLHDLQRILYAVDNHSVLLIFQAMDAAGKDSTIRHVFSGMFPQGGQVFSFKAPSRTELDHDYLWRTSLCLPERGRISIFNRSYYEEVLVTRVHPEYILGQRIPGIDQLSDIDEDFWQKRFRAIRDHERHLAENGTVILKFFLNVSKKEQKRRFLSRIDTPEKNWKFNFDDLNERAHWDAYQHAYEQAIRHTAAEHAPWYVIPADRKWFMRAAVCDIITSKLESLGLHYPTLSEQEQQKLELARKMLKDEL
ncbi:MAG: polyphosphate kinase 2 family protein [Flavobacteriales bacterium]|nr:polyphosphate kinase 2 family protein [Flavobacteriales bacterium]